MYAQVLVSRKLSHGVYKLAHILNGAFLSTIILRESWWLVSIRVWLAKQPYRVWWSPRVESLLGHFGLL